MDRKREKIACIIYRNVKRFEHIIHIFATAVFTEVYPSCLNEPQQWHGHKLNMERIIHTQHHNGGMAAYGRLLKRSIDNIRIWPWCRFHFSILHEGLKKNKAHFKTYTESACFLRATIVWFLYCTKTNHASPCFPKRRVRDLLMYSQYFNLIASTWIRTSHSWK